MKIYMNKYKDNWISPYTVKEKFFFWKKDYDAFKNKPPVWLTKVCDGWYKIANAINRKIDYVKIDYWDTWNMDSSLSQIILPMLKQLKATKHGAPYVDDEDVPPKLRSTTKAAQKVKENPWDTDGNHFKRWDYVLDEMIWAFEQLNDDDHDSKFFDHSKVDESGDLNSQMSQIKFDKKGYKAHHERINNGTRLFGKYYRALWD